jgi:hypothetical protein
MSNPLRLFTVFHLNVSFSSIDEEKRPQVLQRCYSPLLDLIEGSALRAGIEAPAYTLETIDAMAPEWTARLRALIAQGKVELIGSGYSQIIGPLVPAEVNAANLRIGIRRYEELLRVRPRVALVNEQSYSSGLVAHYLNAGFDGLVMEWNNAARAHPEWPRSLRLRPCRAADQHGRSIPLLWNDSVAFQKFQRYAHGEMELDEMVAFVGAQATPDAEAFCLYGNDVEIFDFRPGRFATEATIESSEWARIRQLVDALAVDPRYTFVRPSDVLAECTADETPRQLESAACPVLVKKQPKYNLTRWAVTGRDDIGINSACWRLYERLRDDRSATEDQWQELCYLWGSDFRTHITTSRWRAFRERLAAAGPPPHQPSARPSRDAAPEDRRVIREGRRIRIDARGVQAVVNTRRGLAIDSAVFPDVDPRPLVGTISHGTLDDIALSADWYTGNLVLESPGAHKVTDLEPARDVVTSVADDGGIVVNGTIPTKLGDIRKTLTFGSPAGTIEIVYTLKWQTLPRGSLRLGFVTLLPESFDASSLMFRTHNGGDEAETFHLANTVVEHGAPVSFLVSAAHAVGMTQGTLEIGDARKTIRVSVDKGSAALVGMVSHRRVPGSYFCQVQLSAMELDDTSVARADDVKPPEEIRLRYSAHCG